LRLNYIAVAAIGFGLLGIVEVGTAGPSISACEIPKDLQNVVGSKYPGRTLVGVSDLGDDDKGFFQKEHGNSCPGLARVDFYGDGKPTFAMALTTKTAAKGKTELVVAHQVGATWETTTLETVDGDAPVVWSEKPGEYKDVYGEKAIRATRPVIIFCRYEAWAILYAWTNSRIAKIWVMD
jgi:hypothetical protein